MKDKFKKRYSENFFSYKFFKALLFCIVTFSLSSISLCCFTKEGGSFAQNTNNSKLRFAVQGYINNEYQEDEVDNIERSSLSSTFKYHYFLNMTSNFGNNDVGSCGYVAMAMLLTYFDTYFDDNIVPSSYEVIGTLNSLSPASCYSSPGTNRESNCPNAYRPYYDSSINGYNYSLYKSWLYLNYYSISLHAKLIIDYLGIDNPSGPGVGPATFSAVFSQYFSSINYTNYTYIRSPENATSDEVRSWVIDQLVNYNRPVILGTPGHVTIAYDYDATTNKVFIHNGYQNASHVEFTTQFDDAHTLTFDGSHVDSNNYIYQDQYYCPCQLDFHFHTFAYIQYSSTHHIRECDCGIYGLQRHNYVPVRYSPEIVEVCDKCGAMRVI